MDIKQLFIISRPWSFIMTIISVSLGAVLALYMRSQIDILAYILSLLGAVVLHAATNIINDYFDIIYRVDVPGAPTTKYRPHPIYLIKEGDGIKILFTSSIALYISVLVIILPIILMDRIYLILYWIIGVFLSYIYTGPPFKIKYRAMGELIVFLVWGPLMVSGAFYAVSGSFNPIVVIASIPIGLLVSSVLLANNIRDIEYDSLTGIKTIPIKLGHKRSIKLYTAMLILPYIVIAILNIYIMLIYTLFLTLISLPLAIRLIKLMSIKVPDKADPMTAQLTLAFGSLYIVGVFIQYIID